MRRKRSAGVRSPSLRLQTNRGSHAAVVAGVRLGQIMLVRLRRLLRFAYVARLVVASAVRHLMQRMFGRSHFIL